MSIVSMPSSGRTGADGQDLVDRDELALAGSLAGKTVALLGMGYVGLPTALAIAAAGGRVIGVDINESRLTAIRAGDVDVSQLEQRRLAKYIGTERLELTSDPHELSRADAVIIAVPTPIDGHLVPDLTAVRSACAMAVTFCVPGQALVLTSTTYVGCTRDLLVAPLEQRGLQVGTDIFIAFSPERVDPGVTAHTQETTPRVIGGVTKSCEEQARSFIEPITANLHAVSSPEVAEMTKLLENTFRAVNIALANEFADACALLHINPIEVITAAATKPYGFMPFYPGPGVGGHCIPCDPHYLTWGMREQRHQMPIIEAAMAGIARRPKQVIDRARMLLASKGKPLAGAQVLLVGVAYKPGVADVRESPALEIMERLRREGASVEFSDPRVTSIQLDGELRRVPAPELHAWDLVIVHTVDTLMDLSWLGRATPVLDLSYRAQLATPSHQL